MKELIVISAVWCPSCLILNKHLKKINEEYKDIKITKYDYDLDEDIVSSFEVGKILPVLIINDKRLIGEKSYDEIKKFLEENM